MFKSSIPKIGLGLILGFAIVSTSKVLNHPYGFFDSLWPALLAILIATYYLIVAQAEVHAQKFKNNIRINHTGATLLRVTISFVLCAVYHLYYQNMMKVLDLCLFNIFFFGIVFNYSINKLRDLPTFYLGKDGKKSSFIDSIFNNFRYGGELLFLIEVIGMIGTGWIYLI